MAKKQNCSCCCGDAVNIIYACSGGSNVGQIANEAAKKLTIDGVGKMSCGIALGADLSGFIVSAQSANRNIVIEGCKVGCLRKIFERHGIENLNYYMVTEIGIEKDKNLNVPQDEIDKVVNFIKNDICKP